MACTLNLLDLVCYAFTMYTKAVPIGAAFCDKI